MTILIASLSLFLGLSQKSTMIDITNKFGSPISVTNDEKENLIDFQYNEKQFLDCRYLVSLVCCPFTLLLYSSFSFCIF